MAFVLDSSVALAWLLPDEGNEATDALADRLEEEPAHVPAIWPLEVGNALLVALRRGRIKEPDVTRLVTTLSALPVEVEHGAEDAALSGVLDLARRLGLTAYDAAYVELAKRRGLPLATLDSKLRHAAAALQIAALP
jgi:predicted nucleic acid-binding protein